jgi:hypothetical protein
VYDRQASLGGGRSCPFGNAVRLKNRYFSADLFGGPGPAAASGNLAVALTPSARRPARAAPCRSAGDESMGAGYAATAMLWV